MNKLALLEELRALGETAPSFDHCTPTSQIQQRWLGKGYALLTMWNMEEANTFKASMDVLGAELLRANGLTKIFGILYRAIADLEMQPTTAGAGASGPGAAYDFAKVLKELLASAAELILIVDPAPDEQFFAGFLSTVQPKVIVQLLVREKAEALKSAMDAFVAQKNISIELRESNRVHDRIVCIDGRSCWIAGQPMKVSVRSRQSYLAPLPYEVAKHKLDYYQDAWQSAAVVGKSHSLNPVGT
ncbi:MAG TPA: hypothetical protein VFO86_05155 [Terriglobia bacterium]|nr:hypothetical protein [Terriglobia bacterium]